MRSVLQLILLCVLPFAAWAASAPEMEVLVEAGFEPASAVGLIISESGTNQKNSTKISRVENGLFLVSFALSEAELKAGGVASAMLSSKQGQTAFGDVRLISRDSLRPSLLGISECRDQSVMSNTIQGQFALLESLVNVRGQRRQVLQDGLKLEMNGDFLDKLQRLEEGFGLSRSAQLSPMLEPYELVERLSALLAAIRNTRAHKNRRDAELKQTISAPPPATE